MSGLRSGCEIRRSRRRTLRSRKRAGSGSGLRGGAPFIDITVQEIAVRLKQRLGRLIRTDEDRGTAAILDRRPVDRRWGGLLMRGLPDFELVIVPAGQRAAAGTRG